MHFAGPYVTILKTKQATGSLALAPQLADEHPQHKMRGNALVALAVQRTANILDLRSCSTELRMRCCTSRTLKVTSLPFISQDSSAFWRNAVCRSPIFSVPFNGLPFGNTTIAAGSFRLSAQPTKNLHDSY